MNSINKQCSRWILCMHMSSCFFEKDEHEKDVIEGEF